MPDRIEFRIDRTETPLGDLSIVADHQGSLRAVTWTNFEDDLFAWLDSRYGKNTVKLEPAVNPHGLTSALKAYFGGRLTAIDGLPATARGTEFQRAVWQVMREIPCGSTISYGELARRIGRPKAVRAVGLACGANPIGIVIPCHRVVGANGALTGFGGGLDRKRWLLGHEGWIKASKTPD